MLKYCREVEPGAFILNIHAAVQWLNCPYSDTHGYLLSCHHPHSYLDLLASQHGCRGLHFPAHLPSPVSNFFYIIRMDECVFVAYMGRRWNQDTLRDKGKQVEAVCCFSGQCPAGKLWVQACGCYSDTYYLTNYCCRPSSPA